MPCTGYGSCFQGRARCKTPITCSGLPAEEAIERMDRRPVVQHKPEGPYERKREPLPLSIKVALVLTAILAALAVGG